MPARLSQWWRVAITTIAVAAAVVLVAPGRIGSLRGLFQAFGISLLFSCLIGIPLAFVLPRAAPRLWLRAPAPFAWLGLVVLMLTLAIGGSAASIVVLTAIGYLSAGQFGGWLAESLRLSIVVTLVLGVAVTFYETMRQRLDEATLALRTTERDEAHARETAAEARLTLLESRVQPHFLFNTLNTIAALIPRDPDGAERVTGQLASLLRSSLDRGNRPLVPLEDEIRTTRDYLEIERTRFGSRLRFDVDVAPGTERFLVPPFAVQTLVENSVKHAVSTRRDGGRISVSAQQTATGLRLDVVDDGPGFDSSVLPEAHGLSLLRERLALTWLGGAAMTIDSRPGQTRVTIELARSHEAPAMPPAADSAT